MEITITEKQAPMFSSFQMFAEPDLNLLRETKEVTVDIRKETKTRLSTSLTFGNYKVHINLPIEGFKTHYKEEHSYITSAVQRSNLFVLSKKQNKEVYFEYLKALIKEVMTNYYRVELDTLTVNVHTRNIFE
jgi:hypothetical protein